ncbi:uncharacterized protein KGF55_001555 [Candida pseudojiufengensis]|uniref:uncharacterized protein n=1 Tax=Candida pseudojiufengensis TaxID=497109 RepID=UPI0022241ECB|nr:uncharacterized protein KGF55_001555 [Candida pseudojiufengensis]KAI5965334.1 hypothetical protein KGF55_001555 [Candida pseudojiufengensis]
MLTYLLQAKAELHNIAQVKPVDTEEYSHDYKFKFQCNGCKKVHPKPIIINLENEFEVTGFRRKANLLIKCKECKRERYAILTQLNNGGILGNGQYNDVIKITTHGMRLLDFIPDDQFECETNNGKIIQEIGLLDGEWMGETDNGEIIQVSNVDWNIKMIKERDFARSV